MSTFRSFLNRASSFIVNIGSFNSFFLYAWGIMLLLVSSSALISGLFPYFLVMGSVSFFVFFMSFFFWVSSLFSTVLVFKQGFFTCSFVLLFQILFNWFLILLRPATLTLRIFINLSVGHFLLEFCCGSTWLALVMVFLFEVFVSVVQSYVFFTLVISYSLCLLALSLIF